jgi:type I site-specific restriction-modification system R (restriction) subunit
MSKLSEKNGVEVPIYEWLDKMGWQCRTNDELKGYGRQFSNPIIEAILVERISHINSVSPDAAKRAVDILRSTLDRPSVIEANEQFLDLLCDGVTLTIDGNDRTLKIIDFENVWDNDFTVTRQYWVQGVELVKPDLVCLINGIPLVPFEAKQRAQQSSDWMKGVRDLSLYETKVPRLWASHLFSVACNGRMAKYGVPGASSQYFAEWRDLSVHDSPGNPLANPPADFCTVKTDKDGRLMAEIQTYEALSPHPLLVRPDVADRYDWLITIFRIYLSEFKRLDFDAEFFAAKTRKLIRDSARMTNFIGHLPEIAIDARYLENLRFSKLSESDKLEKILRDIETVIRDRVADNPAYIELDEKLQEIVERKNKETMDLADLLRDTEALYQQLDDVANEPVRMGFADRGRSAGGGIDVLPGATSISV